MVGAVGSFVLVRQRDFVPSYSPAPGGTPEGTIAGPSAGDAAGPSAGDQAGDHAAPGPLAPVTEGPSSEFPSAAPTG